jgi:hypothetical protein
MRIRLVALGLLFALVLGSMIAVNYLHSTPSITSSPVVIASRSPALASQPPVMTVNFASQEQRGALGSYCWDGCSDTYLLIPAQPITVPLSAEIEFKISEPVAPHRLLVTLFLVNASEYVPWSDPNFIALGARSEVARAAVSPATRFEFHMPDRAGDYALSVFGEWQTGDSYGPDASYGFHIVVSDSAR